MKDSERNSLVEQSDALRLELKTWEKNFAAANNGKKASREDIKRHPEIGTDLKCNANYVMLMKCLAVKYKTYNKARDILSGKSIQPASITRRESPRKRKLEDGENQPMKHFQTMKTPSKGSTNPWEIDPYETSSIIRNPFTPSKKTSIGPTPQKDGQVLGIFDLLQEDRITPSKNHLPGIIVQSPVQATPRKSLSEAWGIVKQSRTPVSDGKRFMLDKFATPLKNLNFNGQGGNTPSSVSKLHFSTPSFLKRDSHRAQMPVVNEDDEGLHLSPERVRVPRKPLVRGLSSMLAGLRKMEEDAAEENLEALREMENEMACESKSAPKVNVTAPPQAVLMEDSQPRLPLGGFDDEAMFDSEPEEIKNPTLGRDGQLLKIYKKKGQKRTTRRVNMKPTRSKPPSQFGAQLQRDSDDEPVNVAEIVPETQVDEALAFEETRNFDSDSQSEYTASEGGTRYRRPDQSKKKRVTKDGTTVGRKVNALAHQNFKRLKLRNSGAKGGAAHNSRFRRKR